jgi:hypothetical protein
MSFYLALDGSECNQGGEIIRSAVGMGFAGVDCVGLVKKKIGTFGAHGADRFITIKASESWKSLKKSKPTAMFVGICARACSTSSSSASASISVDVFEFPTSDIVFVVGSPKTVTPSALTLEQLSVCDSLVHVDFPVNDNCGDSNVLSSRVRYIVKASLCFHRAAATKYLAHKSKTDVVDIIGEKFAVEETRILPKSLRFIPLKDPKKSHTKGATGEDANTDIDPGIAIE